MLRPVIAAVFLAVLCGAQDQPLTKEEALKPVQEIFKLTREWDRSTTAGVRTELKLATKVDRNGRSMFVYDLKITGADPDKKYFLVDWPISEVKPLVRMDGLRIDDDGTVYCPANSTDSCTKQSAGAVIQLALLPAKGEISRAAVVSQDKTVGAFFSIVPDPIIAKDKTCSLEVVRLSPQFILAVVRGKGFVAGEQLLFHAVSHGEVHDSEPKADSEGTLYAELNPAIAGKKSGRTELTVRGSTCAPKLSFDWGPIN